MVYDAPMSDAKMPEMRMNLRLNGEETRRFMLVVQRLRDRHSGRILYTDIVKELMGLLPPKLLDETDRQILKHGTDAPLVHQRLPRKRKRGN